MDLLLACIHQQICQKYSLDGPSSAYKGKTATGDVQGSFPPRWLTIPYFVDTMAADPSRAQPQGPPPPPPPPRLSTGQVVFNELPPEGAIRPPYFPRRPELFDEVEWGNLPTSEEAQKAYRIWSMQDSCLEDVPKTSTEELHEPQDCLARNVYENILQCHLFPLTEQQWRPNAQYRYIPMTDSYEPWSYDEIFGPDGDRERSAPPESSPILIKGRDVLLDRFWTKVRLQAELRSRQLDTNGLVAVLRRRLYDDERTKQQEPLDKESLLPREDLSQWGIPRNNDYMLRITSHEKISPLDMYTWAILLSPYNPTYWTSRAFLHYQMGYFDLALGDAYRAQLLCEVLVTPGTRNLQPGLYVRVWDAIEQHICQIPSEHGDMSREARLLRRPNGVNYFVPTLRKAIHHIISLSLLGLHCWSDYEAMEDYLTKRVVMPDRDAMAFKVRRDGMQNFIENKKRIKARNDEEYFFERHYGYVVWREYPYSARDVDRISPEFTEKINNDIIGGSLATTSNAPKITVHKDVDDDLAVYATETIPMGEVIYVDEPSIRGHLHPARREENPAHYCENCKKELPALVVEQQQMMTMQASIPGAYNLTNLLCDCSKLPSDPLFWCEPPLYTDASSPTEGEAGPSSFTTSSRVTRSRSRALQAGRKGRVGLGQRQSNKRQRTEADSEDTEPIQPPAKRPRSCLDIARSLYHYRACGKDWSWLHDAMRPNYSTRTNGAEGHGRYLSHSHEQHGTILSLLLREVFDMTLHRRKVDNRPNLLAHELDEMMPLFGGKEDFRLPFSFTANIQVPFDILQCLGVNIFRDLTFDTWVIQTALRKLIPNVVPWDVHRRGLQDLPEPQIVKEQRANMSRIIGPNRPEDIDPTFRDLYIFPGLAMFNHSCTDMNNATTDWDTAVPNRILVWARKKINKGDEILLSYAPRKLTPQNAHRLFYSNCTCGVCDTGSDSPDTPTFPDDSAAYGPPSSPESDPSPSPATQSSSGPSNGGDNQGGRPIPDPAVVAAAEEAITTMDQLENPLRQLTADEDYDDSTGSDSPISVPEDSGSSPGAPQQGPRMKLGQVEMPANIFDKIQKNRARKEEAKGKTKRDGNQ
ncbi:hypothetical protein FQN55_008684 [Onygenales sp. PD_40]|nr:hypothetical protein FQN55_008684 [Onygenales sp. PD_40]